MTKNAHILEYLTCPLYVSQCQHHTVTKSPPCTWSTHFVIALVSFHHHGGIFFSRHHAVFFFFFENPHCHGMISDRRYHESHFSMTNFHIIRYTLSKEEREETTTGLLSLHLPCQGVYP